MERWPNTHGYPPVAGGSGEEEGPEKAREVFEHYFSKTWSQWRKEGEKELRRVLQEVIRMKRAHPKVYEEFLRSIELDAEVEIERQFREFMDRHSRRPSSGK